ncbi:MAG: hypothetical protein KDC92_07625 [Bacteroidetes bacterium]|nr:hypothetical protein [Bacteroidota bacterium]
MRYTQKYRLKFLNKTFPILLLVGFLYAFGTSKKEGEHQEIYNNHLLTEGAYENGQKSGFWKFYYGNKKLHMEGEFLNDRKQGLWKFYSKREKLLSTAEYDSGVLSGALTFYDKSDKISNILYFNNGEKTGAFDWYKNGIKTHSIEPLKGGRKVTSFYHDGKIKSICNEWNGKQNDTARIYYKNGIAKEELVFYRDMLLNVLVSNNANGERITHGNLTDGEGLLIRYFDNGTIRSKVFYSEGLKNGIAQFYHENGELSEAGVYKSGRKSGIWKYFSENGEFKKEQAFRSQEEDFEFDNEFSFSPETEEESSFEAEFPSNNRTVNKLIKEKLNGVDTAQNKATAWLSLKLDDLGFVLASSIIYQPTEGESFTLPVPAEELPRCIPAYKNGISIASELIYTVKM